MNKDVFLTFLRDKDAQLAADKRFHTLFFSENSPWCGRTMHHEWVLFDIIFNNLGNHLKVLELGSYAGFSACYFLTNPHVDEIICVDVGTAGYLQQLKSNLKMVGKSHHIIINNTRHQAVKDELDKLSVSVDLLFIDAGHEYHNVQQDFREYKRFVKSGGIVAFDDYNDWRYSPEVRRAVDALKEAGEFNEFDIIGDDLPFYGTPPSDKNNSFFLLKK